MVLNRKREAFRFGVFAAALAALPLAGCNSSNLFPGSAYGTGRAEVATIPANAATTADGALAEALNHFASNQFGYSAAYYKRALEFEPRNAEAYVGLGASYDRLGRFDLSDRVYAALYELSGETVQYYNNVGYSYMLRGNLGAALTNFRKAQRLDPSNVVVANNLQMLANASAASRA